MLLKYLFCSWKDIKSRMLLKYKLWFRQCCALVGWGYWQGLLLPAWHAPRGRTTALLVCAVTPALASYAPWAWWDYPFIQLWWHALEVHIPMIASAAVVWRDNKVFIWNVDLCIMCTRQLWNRPACCASRDCSPPDYSKVAYQRASMI